MVNLINFKGKNGEQVKEEIIKEEEIINAKELEKMKTEIKTELYLWDMRCWDKYKDRTEVEKWIENGCEPNNCGHAVYCINELLKNGVSKEEIIELIMSNPYIQFKKRLAKCFENPNLCLKFQIKKNYSDCGGCE